MALPENNISLSLVKSTLDEGSYSLIELRTSPKNNWWGFSSAMRGFGNKTPSPPYRLGDYRGYDHYNRCWSFGEIAQKSTEWGEYLEVDLNLRHFPTWANADTAIHYFDVLFKRTSDFHHGDYTTLFTDLALSNQLQYNIQINPNAPPDGGAALTENQTVYIAIVHKSSPDLKWDDSMTMTPYVSGYTIGGNQYIVVAMTVPDDVCNYYANIHDVVANMYIASPTQKGITGTVSVRIDARSQQTVYVSTEFCRSANFEFDVQTVQSSGTLINTTPGTYEIKTLPISSSPSHYFGIGDTVYYRSKITNVVGGITYATSYTSTKSLVVSNQPPL